MIRPNACQRRSKPSHAGFIEKLVAHLREESPTSLRSMLELARADWLTSRRVGDSSGTTPDYLKSYMSILVRG